MAHHTQEYSHFRQTSGVQTNEQNLFWQGLRHGHPHHTKHLLLPWVYFCPGEPVLLSHWLSQIFRIESCANVRRRINTATGLTDTYGING